jgi:2-iminobutanoate/2-iminopropanoate deaminase
MTKPRFLLRTSVTVLVILFGISALSAADKKVITVPGRAPSPNFSAGLKVGDTLYVAGQTGNDPKTSSVPEDFEAEVKQCLDNVGAVLKAGGADFSDVVAVTVYLTDMDLFQRMNAVYTSVFKDPRPTRTTVGVVKLAGKARVEITVVARP